MKQKPIKGLVHKQLPCRFAIVERFGLVRVGGSEDDKSHVVASVAGAPAVVVAIENVKGMTRNHRRTAIISFRITHRQEVRGINRHEKLEVNLLAGKLIGELRKEVLELTARVQIRDAERIANRLENSAALFAGSIGIRSELIDSVDVIVGVVVGVREETDSALNQVDFVAVGVQFGRTENGMSEVVNESVVRIVSFGAVDDNGLQIFITSLRFAEEFAQGAFTDDRIGSEAVDEFFRNVLVNIVGIRMAEIIVHSRPDVIAELFFKFVHKWIPPKIVKALSFTAQG